MWHILLTNTAERNLKKLPSNIKERCKDALREISADPLSGKPLKGDLKGYYSFRIGNYRIVYILKKRQHIIYILSIKHQKDIYK